MKTQLRDVMNGSLRIEDVGKKVSLCGWCAKKRNLGGLIFVDLRDRSGIVQIVARPENKNYSLMEEVGNEYVLQVKGTVVERESKNSNLPTGDIEIDVDELRILSKAKQTAISKTAFLISLSFCDNSEILVILDDSKRDFSTFAFNVNCCSCIGFCVEISAPNSSLYAFLNCSLEFNANNTDS